MFLSKSLQSLYQKMGQKSVKSSVFSLLSRHYLALTYDLHKNTFICVQNKVSYNIKIPGGLFLICSYSSPSGIDSFLTKFVLIYFPSIIIIIEILFPDLIQPVIYCKQLFFTPSFIFSASPALLVI